MLRLSRRLGFATLLGTMLTAGPTSAQIVQIFEEPPPLELLRSLMIPESRPGGASRRIVLDPPATARPAATAAPERIAEPMPSQAPARTPGQGVQYAAARLPSPMLGESRPVSLAPIPVVARIPTPARTPAPAPSSGATSVGFRINFALNSDVVPQSAWPFVHRIAELLREQPALRLQVEGHTDATGSDEYNLALSQRRAAAVASYLVERQGIAPERLVVLGFGKGVPLTENPFDGRNRRVQFTRVE